MLIIIKTFILLNGHSKTIAMPQKEKLNLFSYIDYRKFLRDYYEQKKKSRAGFSFRTFSKKAGLGSSNLLKRVIDGERSLTKETIIKFAIGLGLNKKETEFFHDLVHFCQAKNHNQKDLYFQNLIKSKNYNSLKPMEKEQYEYYSQWHHSVVKELIVSNKFKTIEAIAQKITPKISKKQIQSSILLLEKMGFIKKNKKDRWQAINTVVTTGPECLGITVMNYHQNLLKMTKQKLKTVPAQNRDVSALVLGLDRNLIPVVKKRIQNFRKEILKLVADQKNPDEVIILSTQLMPYTNLKEK